MKFVSVRGESRSVSFRDALFQGIAPDGNLYVPSLIPVLPDEFIQQLKDALLHDIGERVIGSFIDEIPSEHLQRIIQKAWNFPIPVVEIENNLFLLELFHGPTLAFKDIGARFMAEVMSYFLDQEQQHVTILVATSGDTGSAVAHGFYNVPNIEVFILYPSGKISHLQEQQMTTLGGNIRAIEVEGTFDDCQRLLKQALNDRDIQKSRMLTTANSINLGRLIPQITYYVWGISQLRQLGHAEKPIVVVPSGNFGNLTAAVYAKRMGTPIQAFVAATNMNDVVPQYFRTGIFTPRPSVQTMSNAMDVGNPSNFARLQSLYENDVNRFRNDGEAISISEAETLSEIRRTYERTNYILDPHTAVGVAAARRIVHQADLPIIVTATAHPAKFPDVVKQAIGTNIPLPPSLQAALIEPKRSVRISSNYDSLKQLLVIDEG
ncbi:MAG: threonine synthase [Ignavibacteria bacterium]|nr:threonine synthase [Ignavibacteria bacterium]MBI3765294.1 threonine synthase [Ignavibacteriales bacterium]